MTVRRIRTLSWYVYMIVRATQINDASLLIELKGIAFKMNLNTRKIVPEGLVCVLVALILAGCNNANSGSGALARAAAPSSVPVSVAAARRMDLPVYLSGLGSVTPSNSVSIKSRVDGQLVEVAFKEGQLVQKGQLLAVIDPRQFEVQLSQAQATLFKDQAQLRDAKLNLQRFKDLLKESGAVSQQQVDTQAALVDQLDGADRTSVG